MLKNTFVYILISVVLLSACNKNNPQTTKRKIPRDTVSLEKIYYSLNDIIRQLPDQKDIYGIIGKYNIPFDKSLPNPVENSRKYNTRILKAINLGVYMADLIYIAIFNEPLQQQYLGLIRKLLDELDFQQAISDKIQSRIEKNIGNIDSLNNILKDTYHEIISHFYNNGQIGLAILSVSGFWLESIYLSFNLAKNNIDIDEINEITDKYFSVLNDIINVFNDYKKLSKAHLTLYTELTELQSLYRISDHPITFNDFNRLLIRINSIRQIYTKND